MASSLDQVILHPTVNKVLAYNATNVGRDKLYRAVQYFSRFLAWYLLRKGATKETVQRFAAIKSALGTSRKLFRLGKPVEHLQSASKARDIADPVIKFTTIGRQLGYAGYLCYDSMTWAHNAKIVKLDNPKDVQSKGQKLWFFGITMSLLAGIYKLHISTQKRKQLEGQVRSSEKAADAKVDLKKLEKDAYAVKYQMLQDSLDITIPGSGLGYFNFDDGFVGLAGFFSSLMGMRTQWRKVNKV